MASLVAIEATIASLRHQAATTGGPFAVVVQANKQDLSTSVAAEELAHFLDRPDIPVIASVALSGRGVVDTYLAAVRALGRVLQGAGGASIRLAVQPFEAREAVRADLLRIPLVVRDAAELTLTEIVEAARFPQAMASGAAEPS